MNCKPVFLMLLSLVILFSVFYPKFELFTDEDTLSKEKMVPDILLNRDYRNNKQLRPIKSKLNMDRFNMYKQPNRYSNTKCNLNINKNCNKKINGGNLFLDSKYSMWKPNISEKSFQYLGNYTYPSMDNYITSLVENNSKNGFGITFSGKKKGLNELENNGY